MLKTKSIDMLETKSAHRRRPYRLAVLNSHPTQYFAPMYRALAAHPDIDLTVYYCSPQGANEYFDPGFGKTLQWDIPLLSGYRYKILRNLWKKHAVAGFTSLVNPSIIKELRRGNFDALWLHGYCFLTFWLAIATARTTGIQVLYRSESSLTYDSRVRRSWLVRVLKPRVLTWLFRRVDGFLAIGKLNREFYLAYGAPPNRIFRVPYSVDNEYFSLRAKQASAQRDEIRDKMGIGKNDIVFLFAAKLTPKKAPLELLEAFRILGDKPGKALIIAGDGELRQQAETFVRDNRLSDVHFLGFVNQSELPRYYGISDVFVRPDGLYLGDWGLTVNEAMASGLAIIATDGIGVTFDLVRDGENGRVVTFGDIQQLASAMRFMCDHPDQCRRMGERSLQLIANWSYTDCVNGTLEVLHSLAGQDHNG